MDDFAAAGAWAADESVVSDCQVDEHGRLIRKLGRRGLWRSPGPTFPHHLNAFDIYILSTGARTLAIKQYVHDV